MLCLEINSDSLCFSQLLGSVGLTVGVGPLHSWDLLELSIDAPDVRKLGEIDIESEN